MRTILPICFALLFGLSSAFSQQPPTAKLGPELNEVEKLQVQVLRKDFENASLRLAMIQRDFEAKLRQLREKYKAPKEKFTFDVPTLRFVPKVEVASK